MGALLGFAFGLGVVLVWSAVRPRERAAPLTAAGRRAVGVRWRALPTAAGVSRGRPGALALGCAGLGVAVFALVGAASGAAPLGAAFAVPAAWAPAAVVRGRARRRRAALRDLWPDVVDNLASAIRAGMSLAEALGSLGERGPEPLREPFRRFAAHHRATGRFGECLDLLKAELADPTADRVVESLRLAREVGGSDLGRLLRTLSGFLRDEARTRAELESRQSWTVNAARLAVAAPWVVLALLAMRPEAAQAYDRPVGAVVLAIGGLSCAGAYRLMVALGRLPVEQRVLAPPAPAPAGAGHGAAP